MSIQGDAGHVWGAVGKIGKVVEAGIERMSGGSGFHPQKPIPSVCTQHGPGIGYRLRRGWWGCGGSDRPGG